MKSGFFEKGAADEMNASNHIALGRIYSSTHRYDLAFEHFSAALDLDSSLSEALYYRGICYWRMGDFQLALTDFMSAAELGWNLRDVRNFTSYLRFKLGDYLGANADLDRLFESSSISLRELLFTKKELDTLKNNTFGIH